MLRNCSAANVVFLETSLELEDKHQWAEDSQRDQSQQDRSDPSSTQGTVMEPTADDVEDALAVVQHLIRWGVQWPDSTTFCGQPWEMRQFHDSSIPVCPRCQVLCRDEARDTSSSSTA